MQNHHYTHQTHKVPLCPVKVGVWFAVRQEGLLDLLFFFNRTINWERYVQVIIRQFFPELIGEERLYGRSLQDSATTYTACLSVQTVSDVFGDSISSSIWPASSPELNPCDFSFWCCLKDKVHKSNPQMEQELKENIYREIVNISAEQL
jgi:hypothetical protein